MPNAETSLASTVDSEPINLRAWFVLFVAWMGGLAIAARWGLQSDESESHLRLAVWLLATYAFYLSLCCAFIPLPTTWIVLLAASDWIAAQIGIPDHHFERIVVVATVGAAATGMANLNEYHLITFLLKYRNVARIRETRLYQKASRWFETDPFKVLVAVSLIPIPIDVVRWLAITDRYPRDRYFLAYFIGRWIRYAGLAVAAISLALKPWHILAIQCLLGLAALAKIVPGIIRHSRAPAAQTTADPRTIPVEPAIVGGTTQD